MGEFCSIIFNELFEEKNVLTLEAGANFNLNIYGGYYNDYVDG